MAEDFSIPGWKSPKEAIYQGMTSTTEVGGHIWRLVLVLYNDQAF